MKLPKETNVISHYWAPWQDPWLKGLYFDMRLAIPSTDSQISQGNLGISCLLLVEVTQSIGP